MTIYNERMNTLRELEQQRCKPTFMVVIEKDLIFIIPLRFSPDADQVQSHSRPFCSHMIQQTVRGLIIMHSTKARADTTVRIA